MKHTKTTKDLALSIVRVAAHNPCDIQGREECKDMISKHKRGKGGGKRKK